MILLEIFIAYLIAGDSKSHIFPSKMSSSKFQEVIQLLSDPALLGNKLLRIAKARAASKKDSYEGQCGYYIGGSFRNDSRGGGRD